MASAPSASYGDPLTAAVSLVDFPPATLPLPEGEYRFKVFANSMADFWGLNFLDGNGDGTAGDDYVRLFTIDRTSPTVSITSVGPSPRKDPVSQITIVFDEAVRGLGLADLRLTRNGGSNLLTEANILTTSDEITWTLGGLDDATDEPGSYLLQLTFLEPGHPRPGRQSAGNGREHDLDHRHDRAHGAGPGRRARSAGRRGRSDHFRVQRAGHRFRNRRLDPHARRRQQPA